MRTPENDDLAARLRAAIDQLPVPTAPTSVAAGVRDRRRTSALGLVSAVGLSFVTLVVALIAGAALGERRASLASAPPFASAPPTVAPPDRYGLVVASGGQIVRSEDDPAEIARLYQEPMHRGLSELPATIAVSPDGRRVAYWIWAPSPPGLGTLALMRLGLFDAATGTTRELLTLANESGSGLVWSTDGSGLLFGVLSNPSGSASGATLARLRTFDLASGQTRDVGPAISSFRASGGPFNPGTSPRPDPGPVSFRPLLWDRGADRVAGVTASGNPHYASTLVIIERGSIQEARLDGDFLTSSIVISPDGTTVAGARTRDFALVAWPLGDYAARTEIVPASGERILSLWWRPRTDQLFFVRDNVLTSGMDAKWSRLEVWRPWRDSPRVVDTVAVGIMFRLDGSAYFRRHGGPSGEIDLIDTDSQRSLGSFSARISGTLLLPAGQATPTPSPRQ